MKTFNEIRGIEEGMTTGKETGMMFKVSVEGLPDMIMVGRSPGQIKSLLRKIVKQPSMINDVERMPRSKVKKMYRDLGAGKEPEENVEESRRDQILKRVLKPLKDKEKLFPQKKEYPPHLQGDSIGKARRAFKDTRVTNEEVELDEGAFWGQDKMVKAFKDADKKKGLVRMVKVDGNLTSTMTVKAREIKKWEKKGFKLDPYFDDMREEVELDEAIKYTHAAVDKKGLVIGFASKESDAKDMARRNKGRVVTLTKPLPDNKKSDMMINRPLPDGMDKFPTNTSATQGKRMEEVELDESKMKELAMYIDDIAREMVKDKIMKPFASKFKADAMKSMNPRKSLEKVFMLPKLTSGLSKSFLPIVRPKAISSCSPV